MNQVDVSPERVAQEWRQIAADEGFTAAPHNPGKGTRPDAPGPSLPPDAHAAKLAGVLASLLKIASGAWFTPAWKITSEECNKLGQVWGRVAAKYMPAAWLRWLPDTSGGQSECLECDAVAVTLEVFGPRWKVSMNTTAGEARHSAEAGGQTDNRPKDGKAGPPPQFSGLEDWPHE